MPTYKRYWDGDERAVVTSLTYSGYGVNEAKAMEAINTAFALYFGGMQFVRVMNRLKAHSGDKALADLRDAANTGWGTGCQDLDDAFNHVVKYNGVWSDTKYSHYSGKYGPFYSFIPSSAANFFKAMEARIEAAAQLQAKHTMLSRAIEAVVGDENTTVTQAMAANVKALAETLGEAEKYVWLVPAAIAGKSSHWANIADDGVEILGKVNEVTGLFLAAADETKSAIESFDAAMKEGFTAGQSALLAGLQRMAKFLPVLGEFYSQAIGMIPVVASMMETIAEHRAEMMRLAQYGPTYGQTMRYLGSE